jgi:hypothetical protein
LRIVMNVLLLPLLLAAAPAAGKGAGPRAPAEVDFAFFIPKLEDAAQLIPFLDVAGERSALLRRESWRNEVHPLLRLDVTRKDSLLEAGIDPLGAGTLSFRGNFSFSCVTLADVKKYEAACAERLKTLGEVWRKEVEGVSVVGSKDSLGRVLSGYVLKGKESCAVGGGGNTVEKPLLEAGKLLGKPPGGSMWKTAQALPGQALVVSPTAVVGLKGNGLTLTQEFKSGRYPMAKLAGAGPTPYGGAAFDGLFWSRLRVEPSQVAMLLAQVTGLMGKLCPACDRAALTDAATALAPALSGNALMFVQQVKVKGTLRTFPGRFFAAQMTLLAEASDPKVAREALENFGKLKGAKALDSGEGYSLLLREGEVKVGVRGTQLYFSNDPAVLEATFKALPATAGTQAHGAELGVDPERLARALSQVPLVDVLSVPELAGLLAASAEGGPLLLSSERLVGYADTDMASALRGQLVWTLKKP